MKQTLDLNRYDLSEMDISNEQEVYGGFNSWATAAYYSIQATNVDFLVNAGIGLYKGFMAGIN